MDGMNWMASAMHAAQLQLETASHNLANVTSDGFRKVRSTLALTERGLIAGEVPTTSQGGIRETGRHFDLALLGSGAFNVGSERTRDGAFLRDRGGQLVDGAGRALQGQHGTVHVSGDASIEADGRVSDGGRVIDRIALPAGTTIRSGALESSNVDAIAETLTILGAQRSFETAQKTFVAIDQARDKAVNDVGRLK